MTVRVTDSPATSRAPWWAKRRTSKSRTARSSPGSVPAASPPATT
ncbi:MULTISPECIES: hypothetical protein [unclassified Amycolatopsis]|nr:MULTISPECIES: hypothetical protein [unclassified Amycolatopsis]WSJ76196.1 hypothetical protein OG439_43525 [Amycolatopsis sp. NBC_01307]